MLSTMIEKTNDLSLRLYLGYARLHRAAVGSLAKLVQDLAHDQRGQSGETSMLMRVALVVAILLAIGGLIFAALQALGADVAGKIRNPGWGG